MQMGGMVFHMLPGLSCVMPRTSWAERQVRMDHLEDGADIAVRRIAQIDPAGAIEADLHRLEPGMSRSADEIELRRVAASPALEAHSFVPMAT